MKWKVGVLDLINFPQRDASICILHRRDWWSSIVRYG